MVLCLPPWSVLERVRPFQKLGLFARIANLCSAYSALCLKARCEARMDS